MSVIDTFAKQMKRLRDGGKPVIYKYDELPQPLRVQIAHILRDTISEIEYGPVPKYMNVGHIEERWRLIHDAFAKERGEFVLGNKKWNKGYYDLCTSFLLHESDFDQIMSLIGIAFEFMDRRLVTAMNYRDRQLIDGAIAELNQRFQEHAVGYQYQAGRIVRVDSQYLHAETVEAAVSLLHDAGFKGPSEEFMKAHEHYRKGNNKEAIVSAGNAFESTIKAICDKRGWDYDKDKATANVLINILFSNNLIPSSMQSHFTSLRATLESGLPTVRNNTEGGAHGQGAEPVDVPKHIVSYALHLAATNIVFLIEAHNASK